MGRSYRRDGLGGHMAGSCTPDWTSYLEQTEYKASDGQFVGAFEEAEK